MDSSGPMNFSLPSRYERKRTPRSAMSITPPWAPELPRLPLISSATVPCASENTWKPPESVIIAPSQPLNRWRPPSFAMRSAPGEMNRWKVLPRISS
jgi:hypothetical protein